MLSVSLLVWWPSIIQAPKTEFQDNCFPFRFSDLAFFRIFVRIVGRKPLPQLPPPPAIWLQRAPRPLEPICVPPQRFRRVRSLEVEAFDAGFHSELLILRKLQSLTAMLPIDLGNGHRFHVSQVLQAADLFLCRLHPAFLVRLKVSALLARERRADPRR